MHHSKQRTCFPTKQFHKGYSISGRAEIGWILSLATDNSIELCQDLALGYFMDRLSMLTIPK